MSRARDLADTGSKANFLDNVTANIPADVQTALDAKLATATASSTYAPLASPSFTGTVTSPIVQTDSIKDDSGTRVLASDSGSAWSWGSGLPSGSIIQVQFAQFGGTDAGSCIQTNMSTHTIYVIQHSSSPTSGGGASGLLSVDITPKITGSKIWLQSHVFGEANPDNNWNMVFFFIRSVSSTHTKLASGVTSSSNAGHIGVSMPTRTYHDSDSSTTPEIVNMQYFDTHGVSAGTSITYKVALSTSSSATQWSTNRCINTNNEIGVSSICAIELAP